MKMNGHMWNGKRQIAAMAIAMPLVTGCYVAGNDCGERRTCDDVTSGGGGKGGSPGCMPGAAPSDGGCVDEDHGIFVRANGTDAKNGTRAAPVRTFAKAAELAKAQSKVVFACAETFDEATQEVPSGVTIYGGLDCSDWSWAAGKRTVVTRAKSTLGALLPLRLLPATQGDPAVLVDLEIVSQDAEKDGESSIALRAEQARAHFVRCVIRAGNAADGAPGIDAPSSPAASGTMGNPGQSGGCSNMEQSTAGGSAQTNASCSTSVGGKGGVKGFNGQNPGSGSDGLPSLPTSGQGASFEPSTGQWLCANQDGAEGDDGDPGLGGTADGWIGPNGYIGAPGTPGKPGTPGQGGGGGGGRRNLTCPTTHNYGASGGSGGSGGCGGSPGGGGQAGGSSIAIISIDSELTFSECEIRSGAGGNGGDGGDGQLGGAGGPGGAAGDASATCAQGGDGGDGGDGGAGGGGRGGHSAAIVHVGLAPDTTGAMLVTGASGLAGQGGAGSPPISNGAPGIAKPMLELPLEAN